jgi:hypothetical protein
MKFLLYSFVKYLPEIRIDAVIETSVKITLIVAPNADRIAADQNTSPNNAGINNNPPIR